MALKPLRSTRIALMAGILGTSTLLIPRRTIHADAPPMENPSEKFRKPIYDELPSQKTQPEESKPSPSLPPSSPQQPTVVLASPKPTDRLAVHIGRARLFLQAHVAAAEGGVNKVMTRVLDLENSFTSTVASLAPAPETHERVLPGALYVLVAGLAGSIVTRNRSILLRASVPVAVGVGAGWVVLPYTMRNVADLVWRYEDRVPVISMNHLRIRAAAEEGWRQARERGQSIAEWTNERVRGGREAVESWVKEGK